MLRTAVIEDALECRDETETIIVRRAKHGDELAFSHLYHRYSRPVLAFLYGLVTHSDLAEELMQETFARAYMLLPDLRHEDKFSSWIFGIAKNVARESYRERKQNHSRVELEDPVVEGLLDPADNPEKNIMKQQLYQAIQKGLASLDDGRRTALALRVFSEKSYQEIADITGWTLAKVKTEIHRARLEMRKMMKPYL
jgi:RNA polymerase sigma-70 factor (ECF subfamily)